jgi:hypothetical protein
MGASIFFIAAMICVFRLGSLLMFVWQELEYCIDVWIFFTAAMICS